MTRLLQSGLVLVVMGVLVACGGSVRPSPTFAPEAAAPTMLSIGPEGFDSIAWTAPDALVVGYDPDPSSSTSLEALWSMNTSGGAFAALRVDTSDCVGRDGDPQPGGRGQFTFERTCLQRGPSYLYRVTTGSPELQQLARLDIAPYSLSGVSWAPDRTRAVGTAGDRICEGLVWISATAMSPTMATISADGASYSLGAGVTTADCDATAVVAAAAWSPDANRIAVWAAPPRAGASGIDRLDLPMNLYLLDPISGATTQEGITATYPSESSWSPDGRWLAFSGSVGPTAGLWLVDTTTWKVHLVAGGNWSIQSWSPDGQSLAMLLGVGPAGSEQTRPAIVSVSEIVGSH